MSSDVLRHVPLFSSLTEPELQSLVALTRERTYPKGSVIVFAEDPGDCLFVVLSGAVKVVLIADDGREVILSVLRAGSYFGEMAVLDDDRRSAHVIAMEDASLAILRRDDFRTWLHQSPQASIALLKEMSRRLRRADETIGGLALLDVRGRVAHLLLRMADEEHGDRVSKRLTHQTIAQLVGSSRETVSRTLRELAIRNVIEVTGRGITLKDRESLAAAARYS